MKVKRKIIQIDEELCNGCGNCVISCAEGAIQIIDGKAKIVKDQYCDGLGACIGECPQGALKIIEREADEFDEKAVENYLKELEQKKDISQSIATSESKPSATLACGCPSTHLQTFPMSNVHKGADTNTKHSPCSCSDANKPSDLKCEASGACKSTLGHWPVQIRLIPPTAPFLKGADLLITADCVPVAYPSFHQEFLKGKVVMIGCPKFDDADSYIQKFADIFKTAGIKSVTTLIMEVPCCSGLPMIIKKGMELAGVTVPITKVVISARGEIIA
ncbi:MAG: 4Fe-4S binding protein [Desulfamplus sp.]|nr:4Fe-4S binding protein [Desulfamplus sp.]